MMDQSGQNDESSLCSCYMDV